MRTSFPTPTEPLWLTLRGGRADMIENFREPTLSTFDPPVWDSVADARSALLAHLGGRACEACYRPWQYYAIHVHHIVPKRQIEINTWGNLVLLCGPCHLEIAHRLPPNIYHRTRLLGAMTIARTQS